MEEHRGEGSAGKFLEHSRLLADEALLDQSWIDTLIDRKVGKDLVSRDNSTTADSLGFMPHVIITSNGKLLLISSLKTGSLILELPSTLITRTSNAIPATLKTLWHRLVTLIQSQFGIRFISERDC
jgi:hypothetical protein